MTPMLHVLSCSLSPALPPYETVSYVRVYTTLYRCGRRSLDTMMRLVDAASLRRDKELQAMLMLHYSVTLALTWDFADTATKRSLIEALQSHAEFRTLARLWACKHECLVSVALGVSRDQREQAILYARTNLYVSGSDLGSS